MKPRLWQVFLADKAEIRRPWITAVGPGSGPGYWAQGFLPATPALAAPDRNSLGIPQGYALVARFHLGRQDDIALAGGELGAGHRQGIPRLGGKLLLLQKTRGPQMNRQGALISFQMHDLGLPAWAAFPGPAASG